MQVSGKIVDTLSNILPIKFFVRKSYEKRTIGQTVFSMCKTERQIKLTYLIIFILLGSSYMILQVVSIFWLVKAYQTNHVTAGDFALVLFLNNTIITLFWSKVRSFARFSRIFGEGKQALKIIQAPLKIVDRPNAQTLKVLQGDIEFRRVTFFYDDDQKPIFKNFSLKIPPGKS